MKHTSYVGIDISDSSVKVLQLSGDRTVVAYGNAPLLPDVVVNGRIVDIETFSSIISKVFDTTHPNSIDREDGVIRAIVCLPESKLFSHFVKIPSTVSEADIKSYVLDDARKTIPFDFDLLYSDYHLTQDHRAAVVICAQKKDVDNYVEALTHARIRPVFVGSELFSLGRAVLPSDMGKKGHMIIDIGGRSSTIGVFHRDAIANLSVRTPIAGQYFTRKVSEQLGVSLEEAEKLKSMHGVDPANDQTGVPDTLRACLSELVEEIREARIFSEEKIGVPIGQIYLAGGSSLMPGLASHIEKETRIPTQIADPLKKIVNAEVIERDTPGVFFGTVVGLAILGSNMNMPHINLLTLYRYKDRDIRSKLTRLQDIRSIEDIEFVLARFARRMSTRFEGWNRGVRRELKFNPRAILTVIFFVASLAFLSVVLVKYMF